MKELVYCALVVLAMYISSIAGTTGKIKGEITENETCEPIPYAVVQIEGTTMGAQTDVNGRYEIQNVPVGTWRLQVTKCGWVSTRVESIVVDSNQTTFVNVAMTESTLDSLPCCILITYRDLINVSETQSVKNLNADQLKHRPARNVRETLRRIAGVVYR
ncbi:MAG: carboxypeptidase-like regulatory domain-containing protein [bacterium]|nr:carboxypeptidase-like regulatory domain-containing protein [bacterium]